MAAQGMNEHSGDAADFSGEVSEGGAGREDLRQVVCPLQDSGRKEPGGGICLARPVRSQGRRMEGVKMEMRLACGEENKGMGTVFACSGGQARV